MKIENVVNRLPFKGIKTDRLVNNQSGNVILISIEKGKDYVLDTHDMFSFKKDEIHAVEALENAKLILVK